MGLALACSWGVACSTSEDSPDGTTTSGTGGASLGGQGGALSTPPGKTLCGLYDDEPALKTESEVVKDHFHIVDIPLTNLESRQPGTFTLQPRPGIEHSHTISLTKNDFETLLTTGALTLTSTKNAKHKHEVNLVCELN